MSEDNGAGMEQQAREIGWRPKEEYKGNPDKWVDAQTYLDNGERVLPILRNQNQKLHSELTDVRGKVGVLQTALAESQDTIKAMGDFQAEIVKDRVQAARDKLRAELVAAKKGGDVDAEVQLTDELTRLNAAEAAAPASGEKKQPVADRQQQQVDWTKDPQFLEWRAENPWFNDEVDPVKTAAALGVSRKLRKEGVTLTGRAFLDRVAEETQKAFGGNGSRPRGDKVEGARGGVGGGGGGKGYADLPPDARAMCDKKAAQFVGENRLHKTNDEWRKYYAQVYFAGDQ